MNGFVWQFFRTLNLKLRTLNRRAERIGFVWYIFTSTFGSRISFGSRLVGFRILSFLLQRPQLLHRPEQLPVQHGFIPDEFLQRFGAWQHSDDRRQLGGGLLFLLAFSLPLRQLTQVLPQKGNGFLLARFPPRLLLLSVHSLAQMQSMQLTLH